MRLSHPDENLSVLCGLFGMSANAWHHRAARQSGKVDHSGYVLEMVGVVRERQPKVGTRKLYALLRPRLEAAGIKMGRAALNELLQSHGLGVRARRRSVRTTDSTWGENRFEDLAKGFTPSAPHALWIGDITYIRLGRGRFCFLVLLTDAYSHKIVGWHLGPSMKVADCLAALAMALAQLPDTHAPIHHTDRGSQYVSHEYTAALAGRGIRSSTTQTGDPRENAVAERVNGILKGELGLDAEFAGVAKARQAARKAIQIYNYERLHASIDYLTPAQAHTREGELPRRWKNYRLIRFLAKEQSNDAGGLRQPPAPPGRFVYHGQQGIQPQEVDVFGDDPKQQHVNPGTT